MIALMGNQQNIVLQSPSRVAVSRPAAQLKSQETSPDNVSKQQTVSLEQSLKSMQTAMNKINNSVSLEYDKSLEMIKVLIKDGETNEVIRTIPTEQFILMKANMHELIGNLLDTTA